VLKLRSSINGTVSSIASGTKAVMEIYQQHQTLNAEQRRELIAKTEQTFDKAAEVLSVYTIGNTQLHERSNDLPKWVKCFKELIHYR